MNRHWVLYPSSAQPDHPFSETHTVHDREDLVAHLAEGESTPPDLPGHGLGRAPPVQSEDHL